MKRLFDYYILVSIRTLQVYMNTLLKNNQGTTHTTWVISSCHTCILGQKYNHGRSTIFSIHITTTRTLWPRQHGRSVPDDIFKYISLNENVWISIKISQEFVPINTITALVQIMACRRPGDKPLSEPVLVSLLTHIFVTQWAEGQELFKLISDLGKTQAFWLMWNQALSLRCHSWQKQWTMHTSVKWNATGYFVLFPTDYCRLLIVLILVMINLFITWYVVHCFSSVHCTQCNVQI